MMLNEIKRIFDSRKLLRIQVLMMWVVIFRATFVVYNIGEYEEKFKCNLPNKTANPV